MKNLFVGNLSYSTGEQDLESAFGQFGPVDRVNIMRDRDTGQPRGFAFVEMTNDEDAQRAMNALNGSDLLGRTIVVNEARPKTSGPSGPPQRSGRPGGGGGGPQRGKRREPRW